MKGMPILGNAFDFTLRERSKLPIAREAQMIPIIHKKIHKNMEVGVKRVGSCGSAVIFVFSKVE